MVTIISVLACFKDQMSLKCPDVRDYHYYFLNYKPAVFFFHISAKSDHMSLEGVWVYMGVGGSSFSFGAFQVVVQPAALCILCVVPYARARWASKLKMFPGFLLNEVSQSSGTEPGGLTEAIAGEGSEPLLDLCHSSLPL